MSGILPFLERAFPMHLGLKQHVVSILLLGALLGVFCAGSLSDWIGRKKTISIAAILFVLSPFFSIYARFIYELLIARFLSGIAVGIVSVVLPLYLAEMSPSNKRGMIVSFYQLSLTAGILFSYFVNWCIALNQNWKMVFFVFFAIACLGGFFLFFIPESSDWLLLKKREERVKKDSSWKLFQKGLRSSLLMAICLAMFQQITGINTIFYYAPIIFTSLGLDHSVALFATLIIGIVNVAATILAIFWIDTMGRRKLLIISLIGMLFSLLFLVSFFHVFFIVFLSVITFVSFFAVGLGPVVWVVISEIFPLKWRASGVSIALFVNWFSNYLVSSTFLTLSAKVGERGVFALFASVNLLAFLLFFFFLPETKGKALE
jgi:MFS family permease